MDNLGDEMGSDLDDIEVVYLDEDDEVAEAEMDNENIAPDLSILTFKQHKQSVFSSDLSSDSRLAVTGGEDDMAYVWSTDNCAIQMECTGHKDSVTEVCFNYNNQLVATGDMGGLIQVWNVEEKKLIWCYEGDDLEWLRWHRMTNILFSGTQAGDVYVWQIPQGNCKMMASHGASTTCGRILPDGKRIVVGYSDGVIKLWDIKNTSVIWQLGDFDNITNIEINHDGTLIVSAPSVKLIKTNDGKIIGQFRDDGNKDDIEAVVFNYELNLLITGSLSGGICAWDVGKKIVRHKNNLGATITGFKWGSNNRLYVSTNDGIIYICDVRSNSLVETLTGHTDAILSMCVSTDDKFILTTSDDHTAKIFKTKIN